MPVTKTCDACGDDVTRPPSRFNGSRVFCDMDCMSDGYTDRVTTNCAYCGGEVTRPCKKIENYENNYCNNDCMYAHQVGENAPNWRGGSDKFEATPEGREWREKVFENADYTCQDCGRKHCRLNAHHTLRKSDYPDKKADPDVGRCLCLYCHCRVHFEADEMGAYRLIKGNINRLDNV